MGPHLARVIDRFGQTRVLPFCLLAHGAAIAGVPTSATAATQIAAATCAGAAVPQLGALSGARWAHLLRGERAGELPTAFALESLANAAAFLLGPVLVASLGAVGDAALASAIAAGLILGGGAALAAQRRTAPRPARERAGHARAGRTLLRPAFLLLALLNLAIGCSSAPWGSRSAPSPPVTGCRARPPRSSPPSASAGCSPAGPTGCAGIAPRHSASSSRPPPTWRARRCCFPSRRPRSGSAWRR